MKNAYLEKNNNILTVSYVQAQLQKLTVTIHTDL